MLRKASSYCSKPAMAAKYSSHISSSNSSQSAATKSVGPIMHKATTYKQLNYAGSAFHNQNKIQKQ